MWFRVSTVEAELYWHEVTSQVNHRQLIFFFRWNLISSDQTVLCRGSGSSCGWHSHREATWHRWRQWPPRSGPFEFCPRGRCEAACEATESWTWKTRHSIFHREASFFPQSKWWFHHKAARILSLTIIMVTSFKYSTLVPLVPRRCRSIAEMLTERAMLEDVPPSDRVLTGAKNLLLKYALCNLVRQAAQE